jgi:hypothetical protein
LPVVINRCNFYLEHMDTDGLTAKVSFTLFTTIGLIGCGEIGREQLNPKVVNGCFVNNNQNIVLENGVMIAQRHRPTYEYSVTRGKHTYYTLLVTPCPRLIAGKVGIDERLDSCFVFGEHKTLENLFLIDNKGINYRFTRAAKEECEVSG